MNKSIDRTDVARLLALLFLASVLMSIPLEASYAIEAEDEGSEVTQTEDFVIVIYDILFQEDFDDGVVENWSLHPGWNLTEDAGNIVLSGSGHSHAQPVMGEEWTDYAVKLRFKLIEGAFHFNIRQVGDARYFIGVESDWMYFTKQLGEDVFDLLGSDIRLNLEEWHSLEAIANGTNIRVYLDDELAISYNDDELPIRMGGISFETLENSEAFFDDVVVEGSRITQRTKWVKTGGPLGGLGYDVTIHPVNKSIMFVTDNPSGVQKSYDGGRTWQARNDGITSRSGPSDEGVPNFCLTIDPNDPDIVWAGMQGMRGIFKSVDCGETWMKKDDGIQEWNEITFRGFAVHPENSNIVLAAAEISTGIQGVRFDKTKGKIYKTEDGGENWHCIWEGDNLVRIIKFNPVNPSTIYASTGIFDREAHNDNGVGVLKSTDGGKTWKQINNGINNLFIGFLEMHPENPDILFAAAGSDISSFRGESGAIYKTTDGGEHWTEVLGGDQFNIVTISPSNPNIVYACSENKFYRSDNSGKTWKKYYKPGLNYWGPPNIRPGIPISAVVHPNDPLTIFVNNYIGGVFKSTDGAKTWVDSSKGYTGADIFDVAINPIDSSTVYAVGRTGPFKSVDRGDNWVGLLASNEFCAIANNPSEPNIMLISSSWAGEILKTEDGGNTWKQVFRHPRFKLFNLQEGGHGFGAIDYSPSNPSIVYSGMKHEFLDGGKMLSSLGMYKSTDGGDTWSEVNNGLEGSTKNIMDLAVHPTTENVVYIATFNDGIFTTTDGGNTWTPKNKGLMSFNVNSLAINPEKPNVIYAGLGEGVGIYRSTDGGEIWEEINNGLTVECPSYLQRVGQVKTGITLSKPRRVVVKDYYSMSWSKITSIAIDPTNTSKIFASDERLGVYMSTDAGNSWIAINDGLSTKAVSKLAISKDGCMLYASTRGAGVFRLELKPLPETSIEEDHPAQEEKPSAQEEEQTTTDEESSTEAPSTPSEEKTTTEEEQTKGGVNSSLPYALIILGTASSFLILWLSQRRR